MKKLIPILLILILIVACCFVACNKKNNETVTATPLLEKGFYSPKLYYAVGESFDPAGATVKYYADVADTSNFTEVDVVSSLISGFDSSTAGTNKTMTLTYNGLTLTYTYNVYEYNTSVDTSLSGKRFITFLLSELKLVEYGFEPASKTATVKTYASYVDLKDNHPATSDTATYSYTIMSDGSTALKFALDTTPYVVKVENANAIAVDNNSTQIGISAFDASAVVEPTFEGYISQNENTTTHKFKTMTIHEKKEEYAEKYCIATVDSNYTLKIYELDEAKTADQLGSETPLYTLDASKLFIVSGTLTWMLRENGRGIISASVYKDTGNHIYLNITKQNNSAQSIIGYTVQCYQYTLIDTDYTARA